MVIKAILLCGAFLFAHTDALAGQVGGSRIVWFNLAKDPSAVNERITSFLESGRDFCWDSESIVYMRDKPREFTRELVKRAIIEHDNAAIKEPNVLLKRPYDEARKGFDGIVVYDDVSAPRMSSLTTGRNKVKSYMIESLAEREEWLEYAFCRVSPPIVRRP